MEHIFHIFGGGCGEHLIWPWLATWATSFWLFLKFRFNFKSSNKTDNDKG